MSIELESIIEKIKVQEFKDYKLANSLAQEALSIATAEGDTGTMVWCLIRIGRSNWLMGNLSEAIDALNQALEKSRTLADATQEVETLKFLGNVQAYLQIYDNAINYYRKALSIATQEGISSIEASLYNNIGTIYSSLEDWGTALEYFTKGLSKNLTHNDRFGESICSVNIGEAYFNKASYELAREFTLRCHNISKEDNDMMGLCHSEELLGKIYHANKDYAKAYEHYTKSYELAIELNDRYKCVETLLQLQELKFDQGHYEASIVHMQDALKLTDEMEGDKFVPKIYSRLAKTYETIGDRDNTLYYYKLFHKASFDSEVRTKEEKLRGIEALLQLEQSQQETQTYRDLMRRLEQSSEEIKFSYNKIKIVSEIGQNITATLSLDEIFLRIKTNINQLMRADFLAIGIFNIEENCLEYRLMQEEGEELDPFNISLDSNTSLAVWSFKNNTELLINDFKSDYKKYLKGLSSSMGSMMSSGIFHPLVVDGSPIGIFTVQSSGLNSYSESDMDTIKILVNYVAIAINNARKQEALAEAIKNKEIAQGELEALNQKLLKLSELDGLTNIPNRRFFDDSYSNAWGKAIEEDCELAVFLLDVDHFKQYNDNYGHLDGDKVLKRIANLIDETIRQNGGFAARYGGDEFVAFIPCCDSLKAQAVSKSVVERTRELKIPNDYSPVSNIVTLSVGASTFKPSPSHKREELLNQADSALYESKEGGRNRYTVI